jgi:hypothetical protein
MARAIAPCSCLEAKNWRITSVENKRGGGNEVLVQIAWGYCPDPIVTDGLMAMGKEKVELRERCLTETQNDDAA